MALNLADKLVAFMSPERAVRRVIARAQLEQIASITAEVGDTGVRRSETRWRGASLALRSLAGWRKSVV